MMMAPTHLVTDQLVSHLYLKLSTLLGYVESDSAVFVFCAGSV